MWKHLMKMKAKMTGSELLYNYMRPELKYLGSDRQWYTDIYQVKSKHVCLQCDSMTSQINTLLEKVKLQSVI